LNLYHVIIKPNLLIIYLNQDYLNPKISLNPFILGWNHGWFRKTPLNPIIVDIDQTACSH